MTKRKGCASPKNGFQHQFTSKKGALFMLGDHPQAPKQVQIQKFSQHGFDLPNPRTLCRVTFGSLISYGSSCISGKLVSSNLH